MAPLPALLLAAQAVPGRDAAQCDPSRFENRTAYVQGDPVAKAHVATAADCCSACAADARCQLWCFHTDGSGLCTLKEGGKRTADAGVVSGPGSAPLPTPPPPTPPPTPPPPFVPVPPPKNKPNILFVLTDDHDALINGYDPDVGVAHMPILNSRVRREGTLFTNYYIAFPLCGPSRSTILTGRYPHNTGFHSNGHTVNTSGFHPVQERDTVNVWLNRTGYHTMYVGKYINGYELCAPNNMPPASRTNMKFGTWIPPGWGDWFGFQTVDFFGPRVNVNGRSVLYPTDAYQTDVIANISLRWLRSGWERERPFFMMLGVHAPHEPYTPAPRHAGMLKGATMPADPAFDEPDARQATLPGAMAGLKNVSREQMDAIWQKRGESLMAVDEMIGALLDELGGALDRTYVFFSSDNGYHLGQHRLPPGKKEFFQHDIAVPLIVRGPGVAAGATRGDLVGNYDLAATWAALAGAAPTAGAAAADGVSFAPLLRAEPGAAWRRNASLQEGWGTRAGGNYAALRIRAAGADALYVEGSGGKHGAWRAYFDCAADPWQTRDTYAALPNATAAALAARLAAARSCAGAACPGH